MQRQSRLFYRLGVRPLPHSSQGQRQMSQPCKNLSSFVTILRADDEKFGIPEAVMDAVMQYRFKPGIKDGVRVKTHATVTKAYRFIVR